MTTEPIRALLRAAPFMPFTLRLADGRALPVPHPDFAHVLAKRLLVVHSTSDSEKFEIIGTDLIVSLSQGLPQQESPAA